MTSVWPANSGTNLLRYLIVFAFCVAGCTSVAAVEPARPPAPIRTCNAAAAESLVGRYAVSKTLDQAKRLAGATEVRVLRPRVPMAMNFRSGRLDVEVDRSGRILALSCG